jgi:hypothetical protein
MLSFCLFGNENEFLQNYRHEGKTHSQADEGPDAEKAVQASQIVEKTFQNRGNQ